MTIEVAFLLFCALAGDQVATGKCGLGQPCLWVAVSMNSWVRVPAGLAPTCRVVDIVKHRYRNAHPR